MDQSEILKTKSQISEAVLLSFAADPTLANNLIFEGGGALHFVYDSPRHTSDLDFLLPSTPWTYKEILEALKRGVEYRNSILFATVKPISDRLIEATYSYFYGNHNSIGIDVDIKVRDVEGLLHQITEGEFLPLMVETPLQIFAKKILATLLEMKSRRCINPTYLFDLEYLAEYLGLSCPLDTIRRTARIYHEEEIITQDLIQRVVEYIGDPSNHSNFVDVIKATLLPEVASRYCFDEKYFKRRADQFRQYLES